MKAPFPNIKLIFRAEYIKREAEKNHKNVTHSFFLYLPVVLFLERIIRYRWNEFMKKFQGRR